MPPPGGASVSDLLETAARLFRASALKCLPAGMLAVLCAQLPNVYWLASGHRLSFGAEYDATYDVLAMAGTIVELWLLAAMMLRQRALVLGAPISAGAELRAALLRLPVILVSSLLAGLSTLAGLLLLLAPGVFLMVCYLVLLPVLLFEGLSPYAALLHSVQLIRRVWWKALAAFIIAVLVFMVCAIVLAAVLGIAAALLSGDAPVFAALETACTVAFGALFLVYLSALMLVLHSAASSSA
ncbi:MAG TPA: hypothetical protein VIX87_08730 [Steroidobacteraceae bacterium]